MMTLEQIFNTCEAGLWMAMAVAVALGARRKPCAVRRIAWVASIALLLFGVSDLIEVIRNDDNL